MPIYEYACDACGQHFDRLQKMSDPDPDTCTKCGHTGQVRRQVTAPSFRLAGSGWYETDFKGKGEARHNLAGAGSDSGGGSSDSKPDAGSAAKADPKPATKAETAATPAAKPAASMD